ncbi:heterokaryon incompatibility -domain-containing protein [Rutstroemia sp. NJR-2017a BBW]|nr:heterokaryon incompatibility -domain-containing protein [Rutstroemia sp. NJR-2017a BBW]
MVGQSLMSHLCGYCDHFVLDLSSHLKGPHQDDPEACLRGEILLCTGLSDAQGAARQGCLFFDKIIKLTNVVVEEQGQLVLDFEYNHIYESLRSTDIRVCWTCACGLGYGVCKTHKYQHIVTFDAFISKGTVIVQLLKLKTYVLLGHNSVGGITRRELPYNVSLRSSVARAEKWLKECFLDHHRCLKLQQSALPSRVIDVTEAGKPKIVSFDDHHRRKGFYVALSYCWGGEQPVRTTTKTVKDYEVALHMELFLRLYETQSIQDALQEVSREISCMSQIFDSACVTIIAASAQNCHMGFLYTRELPLSYCEVFRLEFHDLKGEVGCISLCEREYYEQSREPIHQRAWTLQESLLSPRTLVFGSRQLSWICPYRSHTNEWYDNDLDYETHVESLHDSLSYRGLMAQSPAKLWGQVSTPTGSRSLRLKVLADCLILEINLLHYLGSPQNLGKLVTNMWRVCGDLIFHGIFYGTNLQDLEKSWALIPQYRAPSCSWTSVDGRVESEREVLVGSDSVVVDLVDCRIDLTCTSATYGVVKGGQITLRGCLQQENCGLTSQP